MPIENNPNPGIPVHLSCPHCHDAIEVATVSTEDKALCPSCSSLLDANDVAAGSPTAIPTNHPQRVGRYRITRQLGSGSFGDVYLAEDPDLNRTVAIKLPRAGLFDSARTAEMFLAEARRTAKLKHRHLVAVHDVGYLPDGGVFVVMEYINGATLANKVGEIPIDYERVAKLMAKVADAVHYAHRQGLIHRDLKPANVLIDAQGQPHVTDFGLAVHESEQLLLRGQRSGTVAYMSPEQFRGEADYLDGRSDIWALGVILYELLAGRRPFQGATLKQLEDQILHRDAKPLRQIDDRIPATLERICLRCLAKSVAERYPTAADVAADLRGTTDYGNRKQIRGSVGRLVIMCAAVLALISGIAWWSWNASRDLPLRPFDPKSSRPAISVAGRLGLVTTKEPDIYAALEEIAKMGWGEAPGVDEAITEALDDLREPVRYTAVMQIAQWFDTDASHPHSDQMLRRLSQKGTRTDSRGRPLETSERIRTAAKEILQRFPFTPTATPASSKPTIQPEAPPSQRVPQSVIPALAPVDVKPAAPAVIEDLFKDSDGKPPPGANKPGEDVEDLFKNSDAK